MNERICWSCKHCWVDEGAPGYSEWTPAEPAEVACLKGHWYSEQALGGRRGLEKCLKMAENCPDFEEDAPNA